MKLLFYAPQMAAYGGMERHLCTLAAAAAARGHRIRFLTTSDSLSQELRRELTDPAIDFRELAVPRNRASPARKLLWVYAQTLRARATPWDLIYTNGQSALARVVWRAATRKARIVHHHHTAGDSAEQRSWSRRFRGVLATAPEIIGCSPATCEELNRALARSDGHFLPYLTRSAMPAAAVADRQAGRPVRIGFTGRLVVEKGIDTLLRLAERPDLSAVEWHIHGAGAAYPAERFAGRPRVSYHGAYRSAEEQRQILTDLDAVILLTRHNEGMPLSLIEAMSAGLPWIASDRGGIRNLHALAAHAWLVPPDADDEAIAAILRAAAAQLITGATSRVAQRRVYDKLFAPEVVSAQWLHYFEHGQKLKPLSHTDGH